MMINLMECKEYYHMVWIQMTNRAFFNRICIKFKEGILFEDVVYTYCALLNCSRVTCTEEVGYYKRLHGESICGKPESFHTVQSMLDYFITIKSINKRLRNIDVSRYSVVTNNIEQMLLQQFVFHFDRLSEEQKGEIRHLREYHHILNHIST